MDLQEPEIQQIERPQRGRRRRFSAAEKQRLLNEALTPGESISSVARRYGVSASQLFKWRKLAEDGSANGLKADEAVIPASEGKELRAQVRELQRMLGASTMENQILRDALEMTGQKNYTRAQSCSGKTVPGKAHRAHLSSV